MTKGLKPGRPIGGNVSGLFDCYVTVALIIVAGGQKIVKHPSADNKNTHGYRLLRTVTHLPESKVDTGLLYPHARRRPTPDCRRPDR